MGFSANFTDGNTRYTVVGKADDGKYLVSISRYDPGGGHGGGLRVFDSKESAIEYLYTVFRGMILE